MRVRSVLVVSAPDPVAAAVAEPWGTPEATGDHVDGVPLRQLAPGVLLLRRAPLHIVDDGLDRRLPEPIRAERPTLVFPSIHRSESGQRCFAVHPLGNPGPEAEVGGTPGTLNPTDPGLMADALRRLHEVGRRIGLPATFEATHHGPAVELPSFFVEIGYGEDVRPPPEAVVALSQALPQLVADRSDRVALAIGGGHYAPHFTELVLERRWAVGHILSRHALGGVTLELARRAWATTDGCTGILAARAADYHATLWETVGPRRSDGEAPRR